MLSPLNVHACFSNGIPVSNTSAKAGPDVDVDIPPVLALTPCLLAREEVRSGGVLTIRNLPGVKVCLKLF